MTQAYERGRRRGYLLGFWAPFIIVPLLIGGVIALVAWIASTVFTFTLPLSLAALWLAGAAVIFLLLLARLASATRKAQPVDSLLDPRVPSQMREWAIEAQQRLREIGATEEEINQIVRLPGGANAVGVIKGMIDADPEWGKESSVDERRDTIRWLISLSQTETPNEGELAHGAGQNPAREARHVCPSCGELTTKARRCRYCGAELP